MYIQKRGDKYRFYETYIDPRNNLRRTASITLDRDTVKSRKLAQERLNARIRDLTAQPGKYAPITLKALTDAYIESKRATVKPQSHKNIVNGATTLINTFGGDTLAGNLSAYLICATLDKTGKTPAWKNGQIKYIRKLYRWAYRMDLIGDISFLDKIEKYKDNEKERRALKYMEKDEIEKFLDAAKDTKYELLVKFMLLTGMRIGETLALSKDNIRDGKIYVKENYVITLDEIGDTKTETSTREIHIQKELQPIIDQLKGDRPFVNIRYTTFRHWMQVTTESVLSRRLPPHSLRHTHVSQLAAAGVPLDVVSRRLGHADSNITREIYLHVTSQLKDRDAAILDSIRIM